MKKTLALCSLALLLGACARTPTFVPAASDSSAMTPSTSLSLDARTLAAYDWRLTAGRDAQGQAIAALGTQAGSPVRLTFSDRAIHVQGGCNMQFGGYALTAGSLQVQGMAGTMKACAPDLMQRDRIIADLFSGPLATRIGGQPGGPSLVLTTQAGEVLSFVGTPTPETLTGSQGTIEFLEIAPETVACSHPLIPDHQCLNVRERRYSDAGVLEPAAEPWRPLYDSIQGYTHQDGTAAILRVKRYDWKNPPADASSILYVLDLIVRQGR